MTACIVGGHWRSAPKLSALALEERCAAYNLPQGVITQLYRAIAGGKPGVITKIGLHTFVDPRLDGGAINEVGREAARIGARRYVESLELRGERWLLYPSFPIDVALIRGTSVDARGNLATENEAFHHELLAIAQAAPGPNILFVTLLGWQVGGLAGALAATVGQLLPSSLVTLACWRWKSAREDAPLVAAIRLGLSPIAIGLTASAGWIIASGASGTDPTLWAMTAVAALVVWRTRVNLLWLVGAGALLGALGVVG
jgi:chromate transport protein ChrA